MRVLLVHSGHGFSTKDVGDGMAAGLRANGVEVFEYPLHQTFEAMELLVGAAKVLGIAPPHGYPDPLDLGTMGIPGMAMAKRVPWVIFIHGLNIPRPIPETLRRGGYKTALYCTESPYETADKEAKVAEWYDVVFTCEREAVRLFSLNRPDTVHYLPHGYNPAQHVPAGDVAPPCDVFFCGTRYPERDALLGGVDWTGINVVDKTLDYSKQDKSELLDRIVDNRIAAAHYRAAKISLNHHRQIGDLVTQQTIAAGAAASLNPRAYEVPACGGFLLSDARAELADVFGDSVPVYHDSASLEKLIRYYLAHDNERAALAGRQHAAVQAHSWAHRARTLLSIIAA